MTRPAPVGCADSPITRRSAIGTAGAIYGILALTNELPSRLGIAGIPPAPPLQWTWRVAASAPSAGQATNTIDYP